MRVNLDKYLLKVEKPAQYLGNEIIVFIKMNLKLECVYFFQIFMK